MKIYAIIFPVIFVICEKKKTQFLFHVAEKKLQHYYECISLKMELKHSESAKKLHSEARKLKERLLDIHKIYVSINVWNTIIGNYPQSIVGVIFLLLSGNYGMFDAWLKRVYTEILGSDSQYSLVFAIYAMKLASSLTNSIKNARYSE